MQPSGVSDLRDVVGEEKRSIAGEAFADFMKFLHKEVKLRIDQSNQEYLRRMLISLEDIMFLKLVMR